VTTGRHYTHALLLTNLSHDLNGDTNTTLYDVNLLTGAATAIGKFPNAVQIADAAVALDTP
jgi:hypothetical protein